MKTQIVRLSPHQNAKVLAVYAGLFSLFFVIVMAVVFTVVRPMDPNGDLVPFPIYPTKGLFALGLTLASIAAVANLLRLPVAQIEAADTASEIVDREGI